MLYMHLDFQKLDGLEFMCPRRQKRKPHRSLNEDSGPVKTNQPRWKLDWFLPRMFPGLFRSNPPNTSPTIDQAADCPPLY